MDSLKKINKRLTNCQVFLTPNSKKRLQFGEDKVGKLNNKLVETESLKSVVPDCTTSLNPSLFEKGQIEGTVQNIENLTNNDQSDKTDDNASIGLKQVVSQMHRKLIRKMFIFNLMVIGKPCLGKSTLVNSLFRTSVLDTTNKLKQINDSVCIKKTTVILKEDPINMQLSIINAPGFGEQLNNVGCWNSIVDYIRDQYRIYMLSEIDVSQARRNIIDSRVHCCLYFIEGREALSNIDIGTMKNLHNKVNLIPIIPLADSFTSEELTKLKARILEDLNSNGIKIFDFPDDLEDEQGELLQKYRARIPFAVTCSNNVKVDENGNRHWLREYSWGTVDIEDLQNSDFKALRDLLINFYMIDLVESTNLIYENFRVTHLKMPIDDKVKQQYSDEEEDDDGF